MKQSTLTSEQQRNILERLALGETPATIATDLGISNSVLSSFISKLRSRKHGLTIDKDHVLTTLESTPLYDSAQSFAVKHNVTLENLFRTLAAAMKERRVNSYLAEVSVLAVEQLKSNQHLLRPKVTPTRTHNPDITPRVSAESMHSEVIAEWDDEDVATPVQKPVASADIPAELLNALADPTREARKAKFEAMQAAKRPVGRPPKPKENYDDLSPEHMAIINSYPYEKRDDAFARLQAGEAVPMHTTSNWAENVAHMNFDEND